MRVLYVNELSDVEVGDLYASPPRDLLISAYPVHEFEGIDPDEEVAALMAGGPINIAPVVDFVLLGTPPLLLSPQEFGVGHLDQIIVDNIDIGEIQPIDEEEEAARLALLRDVEEDEDDSDNDFERWEEEEEDAESGYESVDSDAETIENVYDDGRRQPNVPMDEDESDSDDMIPEQLVVDNVPDEDNDDNDMKNFNEVDAEVREIIGNEELESIAEMSEEETPENLENPENLGQLEVSLRRLICLKKKYFEAAVNVLKIRRERMIKSLKRRLNSVHTKLAVPINKIKNCDLPRRNRDLCFGCGKNFYLQRTRRWARCDACGDWLCPDCNEQPDHCQNEDILNDLI